MYPLGVCSLVPCLNPIPSHLRKHLTPVIMSYSTQLCFFLSAEPSSLSFKYASLSHILKTWQINKQKISISLFSFKGSNSPNICLYSLAQLLHLFFKPWYWSALSHTYLYSGTQLFCLEKALTKETNGLHFAQANSRISDLILLTHQRHLALLESSSSFICH